MTAYQNASFVLAATTLIFIALACIVFYAALRMSAQSGYYDEDDPNNWISPEEYDRKQEAQNDRQTTDQRKR